MIGKYLHSVSACCTISLYPQRGQLLVPMTVKMLSFTMSFFHSDPCTNSLVVEWSFTCAHSSQTQLGCCSTTSGSMLTNFRNNPFHHHSAHMAGRSKTSCDFVVLMIRGAAAYTWLHDRGSARWCLGWNSSKTSPQLVIPCFIRGVR